MHLKTLALCGAAETNQRAFISVEHVDAFFTAPRGSSDATTEADTMPRTYINGLEHDDGAVERFISICRSELSKFPRQAEVTRAVGDFVAFRNPTTNELIYLTPETAEFLRREGIAA